MASLVNNLVFNCYDATLCLSVVSGVVFYLANSNQILNSLAHFPFLLLPFN
jgi:hypothetical protein